MASLTDKGHIVLCPNPQRDIDFEYTRRVFRMLRDAGEEIAVSPLFDKYGGA